MFFQDVTTVINAASVFLEKEASSIFYSDLSSKTVLNASNISNGAGSLWAWMTFVPLGVYSLCSIYANAVDCYRFIVAWNSISRTQRMDLEIIFFHRNRVIQRRMEIEKALDTRWYSEMVGTNRNNNNKYSKNNSDDNEIMSPICLNDFEEYDMVSSCKKDASSTCHHLFHKDCLQAWLHKQQSCPCCRHRNLSLAAVPQHPLLQQQQQQQQQQRAD